MSSHPGFVETDLYSSTKETNLVVKYLKPLLGFMVMQTVAQGARNQLWAVTTTKDKLQNGGQYKPIANLHIRNDHTSDEKLAGRLWDWTQQEFVAKGY